MNCGDRVDDGLGRFFEVRTATLVCLLWISWHLQIIRVLGLSHPDSESVAPQTRGREAQLSYPGLRHGDNQSPWLSFQEGTNPVGYNATNSNIQVPFSISSFPLFLSLFSRYPIPLPSFLPFLSFLSFPSFLPFLPFLSLPPSHSYFVFHFIFQFLFKHG